jgi:AraC-like DNA-binding protein
MGAARLFATNTLDLDAPSQSLLGIGALAAELAAQGVSVETLFAKTGVQTWQLEDPAVRISPRQRLALYRNGRDLAKRSGMGLQAGARQKISDYGIYGFAMLSSQTFGEAFDFALEHIMMASPVMQMSIEKSRGVVVLRSHALESLGDMLPFVAEFWRSSIATLFGHVLEAPFPSRRMAFTYPAPPHWRTYERVFNCPVSFGAPEMEWEFESDVLARPCPNANPITAQVCQQFCDRVVAEGPAEADLPRQIRAMCMNMSEFPTAAQAANKLGLSLRTLHRRMADEGLSYRGILNGMRERLAIELLENTHLLIDQVAERVGFADATSFRRAFVKWTGRPPTSFRRER